MSKPLVEDLKIDARRHSRTNESRLK
jgi:hypothetical protein